MKVCPECKKEFSDEKRFCNIDGSELISLEITEKNISLNKKEMNAENSYKSKNSGGGDYLSGFKDKSEKFIEGFKPARITFMKDGNLTDNFFDLKSNYLIAGRFDSSTCPIDIDLSGFSGYEHISRKHAKFTFENGKWFVSDAGSTNGVFVKSVSSNEFSHRITEPVELHSGDEISLGNMFFTFSF